MILKLWALNTFVTISCLCASEVALRIGYVCKSFCCLCIDISQLITVCFTCTYSTDSCLLCNFDAAGHAYVMSKIFSLSMVDSSLHLETASKFHSLDSLYFSCKIIVSKIYQCYLKWFKFSQKTVLFDKFKVYLRWILAFLFLPQDRSAWF